jgi:hypothetical protein
MNTDAGSTGSGNDPPQRSVQDAQLGDEFIALTFNESDDEQESEDDDDADEESEDEGMSESPASDEGEDHNMS